MANTATTFTIFRKSVLSVDGLAFSGKHAKNPQKENGILPAYQINMGNTSLGLLEQTPAGLEPAITGYFEGISLTKALLHTKNSLSSARSNSTFSRGWTFVYLSTEYKWKVSLMSTKWTLTDVNKQVVASFKRSMWKMMHIGTLTIHVLADPELTALIILTCKMVHYTNELYETTAII
ncbi:hypothetical protein LPJ59_001145 [Coemansia sp. RSA 2399]|nr:hypothetical protein LPJ59_001145 [Coemansia sp. RSA 2399]KAJ1905057.1 hypothetical protein LPJ81_002137 [Coemansia sp. IMI 209127]